MKSAKRDTSSNRTDLQKGQMPYQARMDSLSLINKQRESTIQNEIQLAKGWPEKLIKKRKKERKEKSIKC